MMKLLSRFFDQNKKDVKYLENKAIQVENLSPEIEKLSDDELKAKTEEFKGRYKSGETLDELLVEAFAVAREAAKRVLGMHPYRVQIMGSIALHEGNIAEMKTGEGKTLTATMAVYLNAISGKGVHVVTVNEYLSKRDAQEMGELYNWLGLTVGLNNSSLSQAEKREAYSCDITYSTNNELGFDYLRDNMATSKEARVQRGLHFAVIDEVDSVLIDEARTPLIVSGDSNVSPSLYIHANNLIKFLEKDVDYIYDVETNSSTLTPEGIDKAERGFGIENLYSVEHSSLNHAIGQALAAHTTLTADVDYVVQDGEILIVDNFTGRMMKGRRFSDGLHQALEAKEGLEIKKESKTMASVTFQNYFRKYEKLSGMTGTAETEKDELLSIYNMKVIIVPTNKEIQREDKPDLVFTTIEGKFKAVVQEVKERHEKGQPVLIGTVSIDSSEIISNLLTQEGIPHNVLNAKKHDSEAEIIANAGQLGAVTIATNMAGRGTDIKPGEGVLEVGGLAVIGTERHESRRIDNQLRGRSGRQGNVGVTQFYLSLEDPLMLKLGSEKMQSILSRLGVDDETPIQSKMISKAVESAQLQAEGGNYEARKRLLQFDEVLREQRELIYKERDEVLELDELRPLIEKMIKESIETAVEENHGDLELLENYIETNLLPEGVITVEAMEGKTQEEIIDMVYYKTLADYNKKEEIMGERMIDIERYIILKVIDDKWVNHIDTMEQLRQGIHLRAYAQIDPLREYQQEGFAMFQEMVSTINKDVARFLLKSSIRSESEQEQSEDTPMEEESKVQTESEQNNQVEAQEEIESKQNIEDESSNLSEEKNDSEKEVEPEKNEVDTIERKEESLEQKEENNK